MHFLRFSERIVAPAFMFPKVDRWVRLPLPAPREAPAQLRVPFIYYLHQLTDFFHHSGRKIQFFIKYQKKSANLYQKGWLVSILYKMYC